jgi:hypothetical protein
MKRASRKPKSDEPNVNHKNVSKWIAKASKSESQTKTKGASYYRIVKWEELGFSQAQKHC